MEPIKGGQSKEEFQTQMMLNQLATEKRKVMNERMVQRMETTYFPQEKITDRWRFLTKKALMNTIPVVSKTSVKDFTAALRVVMDKTKNINMNQFQVLANSLDTASPASIGLSEEKYLEAVDEIMATVDEWGKMLEVINKEVTVEVEREMTMKAIAMKETYNAKEAANSIMNPVKGEA